MMKYAWIAEALSGLEDRHVTAAAVYRPAGERAAPIGRAGRPRALRRVLVTAAALALLLALGATAYAAANWTGFLNTSGMDEESIRVVLREAELGTASVQVDPDGTAHYFDREGNEVLTLSAGEAAEYEARLAREQEERVRASTDRMDVDTLPYLPKGITELAVADDVTFTDFALGNGYVVLLYPEGEAGFSLRAGDVVTLSLEANDACLLEIGAVEDGRACAALDTERTRSHSVTYEVPEDGVYCFIVGYTSSSASNFTHCRLEVTPAP
ncbi:MAG: hypothetical protein IJ751_01400 [Oscillospiraceae bacterium]|nr:hypothetical protein [Oscillospiraceae bacterium]